MFRIREWVVILGLLHAYNDNCRVLLIKRLSILILSPIKLIWEPLHHLKESHIISIYVIDSISQLPST